MNTQIGPGGQVLPELTATGALVMLVFAAAIGHYCVT